MEERKQFIQNIFKELLISVENIESTKRCIIAFKCQLCDSQHNCSFDTLRLRKFKTYCNKCSSKCAGKTKTASIEDVIVECQVKFNKYYSYKVDKTYINKKSIITIICPLHGEFQKSVQKHLAGQACFRCRIDKLVSEGRLKGGYTDKYFTDNPDKCSTEAVLYYVKIGEMYKIGITTNLYNRLKSLKSLFKLEVSLIDTFEGTLQQVYNIEQSILNANNDSRIYTKKSTELFKYDVLNSSLKNVL